jgi:hypothetical protein
MVPDRDRPTSGLHPVLIRICAEGAPLQYCSPMRVDANSRRRASRLLCSARTRVNAKAAGRGIRSKLFRVEYQQVEKMYSGPNPEPKTF